MSQPYTDIKKSMLFPGDTIVVPPTLPKNTLLRTLSIAQIVGNLALGAGSIAVIAKQ